jgi:hypothetical protein
MPRPDELPDTIKSFAFHNAAQVDTGRDFHPHVDRLIRSMDRILQGKGAAPARCGWLLGGIAAACVGLIAAGIWLYQATVISAPPTAGPVVAGSPPPQPAPPSPPGPVRLQAQPWQAFPQTAAAAFPAMIENLKRDG